MQCPRAPYHAANGCIRRTRRLKVLKKHPTAQQQPSSCAVCCSSIFSNRGPGDQVGCSCSQQLQQRISMVDVGPDLRLDVLAQRPDLPNNCPHSSLHCAIALVLSDWAVLGNPIVSPERHHRFSQCNDRLSTNNVEKRERQTCEKRDKDEKK